MKKGIAGNLSTAAARNHAKVDATVASKYYSKQTQLPLQNGAKLFHDKLTYR